jgi:hypothetical protein
VLCCAAGHAGTAGGVAVAAAGQAVIVYQYVTMQLDMECQLTWQGAHLKTMRGQQCSWVQEVLCCCAVAMTAAPAGGPCTRWGLVSSKQSYRLCFTCAHWDNSAAGSAALHATVGTGSLPRLQYTTVCCSCTMPGASTGQHRRSAASLCR